MGTRCDFYVMDHDGLMEWLGSSFNCGSPFTIPTRLLVLGDRILFEEEVISHLRDTNGVIKDDGKEWPWLWSDSRMTDYTYIFHVCSGKVLVCKDGSRPVDPVKLLQGMDMIGADVGIGEIKFPAMRENKEEFADIILNECGIE